MPSADFPRPPADRQRPPLRRLRVPSRVAPGVIASLVFLCAMGSLFHAQVGVDPREYVITTAPAASSKTVGDWDKMSVNDLRFVVAVLDRNARTLVTAPGDLFQLGQCHPQPDALALGEPMIAPSILGTLVTPFGDPLVTYGFVLLLSTLLAAFSLYWLVGEWTGVPAAGIVAGLLYGFHTIRMRDPVHFFVWDNAWTILALLFARRLFVAPRWRDAIALSLCCGMQIAGSVYPLLAAVVIGSIMAAWFVYTYGVKRLRPAQIAFVVAFMGVVAWAVLSPYFGLRETGQIESRDLKFFLPFHWLTPGTMFFPGVVLLALSALGLGLARGSDRENLGGDPRLALFAAGLVCLALATGGSTGDENLAVAQGQPPPHYWLPNLWDAVGSLVPALDSVRSPAALLSGVHTILCILAGLGAAALIRITPTRFVPVAITVLIAVAYVDTLRPASLGLTPRQRYAPIRLRPEADRLAFFRRLAEMGNDGPIYEVAFPRKLNPRQTEPLLLSSYHRRPTSVCYNSFVVSEAADLWSEVDDPRQLMKLREMGFTTLLVHAPRIDADGRDLLARVDALIAQTGDRYLVPLAADSRMSAFGITGAAPPADWRSDPRDDGARFRSPGVPARGRALPVVVAPSRPRSADG